MPDEFIPEEYESWLDEQAMADAAMAEQAAYEFDQAETAKMLAGGLI